MWRCKVCEREFEKTNQSHSCGKPEKTIDAYIASQPDSVQPFLDQVRDTLRTVLPKTSQKPNDMFPHTQNSKIAQ